MGFGNREAGVAHFESVPHRGTTEALPKHHRSRQLPDDDLLVIYVGAGNDLGYVGAGDGNIELLGCGGGGGAGFDGGAEDIADDDGF